MVVTPYELGNNLVALGLVEAPKLVALNKGGTVTPVGPAIKIHMVPAEHSSSLDVAVMKPESTGIKHVEGGTPVGYVIEFENGFRIYHTGDTDVFGDMALINRFLKPDLALVRIGGLFHDGPGTRGLRAARIHQAQAGDPHALRDVSSHQPYARRAQGCARQRTHQGARHETRRRAALLTRNGDAVHGSTVAAVANRHKP